MDRKPTPLQLLIKEMPGDNLPSFPYQYSVQFCSHYSGTRNAGSECECDLDRIKNILHPTMLCERMGSHITGISCVLNLSIHT